MTNYSQGQGNDRTKTGGKEGRNVKGTIKIEVENIEEINSTIDEVIKKAEELRAAVQRLDVLELDIKASSS